MLPFALGLVSYRERPCVHIGVLSLRLVLQSFCRPRRPGKTHAVAVNTVSFDKFLLARSCLARLLTVDHILAYAKGGVTRIRNAQPMHRRCNSSKGAR